MAGFCEGDDEVSGRIKYKKFLISCGIVSFSGRTVLHEVSYSFILQISLIQFFWNMTLCGVINSQRILICIWYALP